MNRATSSNRRCIVAYCLNGDPYFRSMVSRSLSPARTSNAVRRSFRIGVSPFEAVRPVRVLPNFGGVGHLHGQRIAADRSAVAGLVGRQFEGAIRSGDGMRTQRQELRVVEA